MVTKFDNIVDFDDMVGEFNLASNSDYQSRFNSMVTDNEYKETYKRN